MGAKCLRIQLFLSFLSLSFIFILILEEKNITLYAIIYK